MTARSRGAIRLARPGISADQTTKFVRSLAAGEPNREQIALTILADRVLKLLRAGTSDG